VKKYFELFLVVLVASAFAFSTPAFADSPNTDPSAIAEANGPGPHPDSSGLNEDLHVTEVKSIARAAAIQSEKPVDTVPTAAKAAVPAFPALNEFVATVKNDRAEIVVGVYAPKILALKVIQQPANKPTYVSAAKGAVTQFDLAAQSGTIGLLAHNYVSGALFFDLASGQEVYVVYGDGTVRRYTITSIRRLQALDPFNPFSRFVDLDNGGPQLSSTDLFNQVYTGGNKVVFQTCIDSNGNSLWGRLFVTAMPSQ
jgi:hypothetical protein